MGYDQFFDNIINILAQKRWDDKQIVKQEFLSKALKIGKTLDSAEREFFIEALKGFEIFPDSNYSMYLREILNKISFSEKRLIIAPLLSATDFDKQYKSSNFVARLFKSTVIIQIPALKNKNLVFFNENLCIRKEDRLVLVDDFIGTGLTAHSCVSRFESMGISKDKITIISFVIMEQGLKKLVKEGLTVFYYKKLEKGISGRFKRNKADFLITANQRICSKRNIDNSMGFGHCQGLVSMQRTPNNTFPVFWDNKIKYPLFPRDKYE